MGLSDSINLTLCVPRPSFVKLSGSSLDVHEPVLVESNIPRTQEDNFVLIRVDRFGFSANNVTYQALGEAPHFGAYFDFHTVPEKDTTSHKTHGLIPVWGFGTVVWSSHRRIDVGRANRRPYNQITRCRADPQYDSSPAHEDFTMLYRPLYWTSFWCADWLAASRFRGGCTRFLISSASSKTAFCLAYLFRKHFQKEKEGPKIVGLTSVGNVGFTRGLGLYDDIVAYDALASLFSLLSKENEKWIYVDVAGNDNLNSSVRELYSSSPAMLVSHITLGMTNLNPTLSNSSDTWTKNTQLFDKARSSDTLLLPDSVTSASPSPTLETDSPLPDPELFFMPEWLVLRRTQLSISEIMEMQADAWAALLRDGYEWVRIERVFGGERVLQAYKDVRKAKGGMGPETGFIWSIWDENSSASPRLYSISTKSR
ncbi:hypothetical protein DFH11DRAFT_1687608 [Phellopilus nigrolimitatus]|nr:hypothetical protein DFH11DRAFT_1687608 [Phellopilus nigrolimitatus]